EVLSVGAACPARVAVTERRPAANPPTPADCGCGVLMYRPVSIAERRWKTGWPAIPPRPRPNRQPGRRRVGSGLDVAVGATSIEINRPARTGAGAHDVVERRAQRSMERPDRPRGLRQPRHASAGIPANDSSPDTSCGDASVAGAGARLAHARARIPTG